MILNVLTLYELNYTPVFVVDIVCKKYIRAPAIMFLQIDSHEMKMLAPSATQDFGFTV